MKFSGLLLPAWIIPSIVLAQSPDRIVVNGPTGPVSAGQPFGITIQGLFSDGSIATNWQAQLRLLAFNPAAAKPVISEIDANGESVEVTNPGDQPVDISAWEIQAVPDYGVVPNARLVVPAPTILTGRTAMTWSSRGGTPPGSFPSFISAKRFNQSSSFKLVRLIDSAGIIVDEVYFRSGASPPDNTFWKGAALGNFPTNVTENRIGYANHSRSVDWVTNLPSPGIVNSALAVPWTNSGTWTAALPALVQASDGVWSGSVSLPGVSAGTTYLRAEDGAGLSGATAPFNVIPAPLLSLEVSGGLQPAYEAQAGFAGTITVSIPFVLSTNLSISLNVVDTNEFVVPGQVIIAAGSSNATFAVTNIDDGVPDGMAQTKLIAMADGFASATALLFNADKQQGQLTVVVSGPLREDSGFVTEPGRIFLPAVMNHDVLININADPPLVVPSSVVVPAGSLSQPFPVRVGDDSLVNALGRTAQVRAITLSWPAATATVVLLDDEDGGFTVGVPSVLVEGTPATGRIQVNTAHEVDTIFTLTTNTARLVVPPVVALPAGALFVDFAMQVPNNNQPDPQVTGQVCIQTAGQPSICKSITLADDEVTLSGLSLPNLPLALLAGRPFPFSASLVNSLGSPQRTNVSGTLQPLVNSALVQVAAGINPLQFTNGVWSNSVTLLGEALDMQMQVSAAGFQTNSVMFDLLSGRETPLAFSDAVWNKASTQFLIAELPRSNAPPRLTEIDPQTGLRGRSLDLARQVRRIALSDDGKVAWLASTQSTLQRVDLGAWQFDREFPLDATTTNTDPRDIVVLPQQPERAVVVLNVNNTGWRIVLFDHGLGFSNRATMPGTPTTIALANGRTVDEVFCHSFGFLSRFLINSNGVTLDRSTNITTSSQVPSLQCSGGLLYRGTGEVFLPDTLAQGPRLSTQGLLGCVFPDFAEALYFEQSGLLKSYNLSNGSVGGSHWLPSSVGAPIRLLRWGTRGLATFTAAGTNLVFFETLLLATNLPDLALTVRAPDSIDLPDNNGSITNFSWDFGITNVGATVAPGVELQLTPGEHFYLGTIAPGDGTAVSVQRGAISPQVLSAQATLTSAIGEVTPSNNTLTVVTRVKKRDLPSIKELILGMSQLIVSPSGNTLYAAVSQAAADTQDGVAVINPANPSVDQILPVGPNPQRLAISGDGSRLFVLLGTNTLVRWNLTNATNESSIVFTNESVLDFATLAGSPTSIVVATTSRVSIFDGVQPRTSSYVAAAATRFVGFAGGILWVSEPGQLRPFTIGDNGLTAGTPTSLTLSSGNYSFASDGRYLYMPGAVFDTSTRQIINKYLGDSFCVDTNLGRLFTPIGTTMRSYSLTNYSNYTDQALFQVSVGYLTDPVRWGSDGLAAWGGRQLMIFHSPLIPSSATCDLNLSMTPPANPIPYQPFEWLITVTNRSNQATRRTILYVNMGDIRDLQVDGPNVYVSGPLLVCDIGDLAGFASVTVRLRGWTFPGTLSVSANVLTAAGDTNPSDNSASASVPFNFPPADLGVFSISAPDTVQVGQPFNVAFVFTNAGPAGVSNTLLELVGHPALQFVGVVGNAYPTNEYGPLLGALGPGESRRVNLTFVVTGPGVIPVGAYAEGGTSDPNSANNRLSAFVFASSALSNQVVTEISLPGGALLAWDRSRRQVLAAFPNDSQSLFILDPNTLQPLTNVALSGLPANLAPCLDGSHVWVSLAGGVGTRVDLNAMAVDQQFNYDVNQTPVWSVATPPGQPATLLVAIDPGYLGNNRIRIFDNGVRRSGEYALPSWAGGGVPMLFTPDKRLFVGDSQFLRQLDLTPSGFSLVRNLDYAGLYDGLSLSYSSNRLFFSQGRVVNLDTGVVDDTLLSSASPLVADNEVALAYTAVPSRLSSGGGPMVIRSMDATTLEPGWRVQLTVPSSEVTGILPMGTNGVLVLGDKARVVKPALLGTPATDLTVSLAVTSSVPAAGMTFSLQVTVSNPPPWTARNTQLTVELASGLVFAPGSPGAGTSVANVIIGSLDGVTNLSLQASAVTNGNFTVRASVTNSVADPVLSNNVQQALVNVLPTPMFYLDNARILEGSAGRGGSLDAWLSRPAPTNMTIGYNIGLGTAQSNDFIAMAGTFTFLPGQQKASSFIIQGDSIPEFDETAVVTLIPTNVIAAQAAAQITIVNDDWPQASVTNVSLMEGNIGTTNALFRLTLSATAPFPVEVFFRILPGTATAGSDYLAREGWVRFEPGENIKTIPVPVLGDTVYEPSETAFFALLDNTNSLSSVSQATLTILNDDLPPAPHATLTPLAGGSWRIDFDTVAGATYQLQNRTNFTTDTWRNVLSAVIGNGQPAAFNVPPSAASQVFFRVSAR